MSISVVSCRALFSILVLSLLAMAGEGAAQTPPILPPGAPPPGTSPEEIRRQLDGLGLRDRLRERIRAEGMTQDQVRRRLAAMGYDPNTLDPYLTDDDPDPPDPSARALAAVRRLQLLEMPDDTLRLMPPDTAKLTVEELRLGVRVFGIDVFQRGSSTEFEPVGAAAVPSDYVLGPGDELVLVLTGDVEIVHSLPVTREGFILIPQVGQVWVNGLSLQGLRDQLFTRLGRVYSGVRRGADATTHFDISLARLRTSQIYVAGEVVRPGAYTVSPHASVLNVLYQSGGPTGNGSFRNVRVMRGGRLAHEVDLYAYLVRGDNLDRIRLQPGDVIFVPVRGQRVSIRGEITREAIYELRPDETLADLIYFAGGPSTPAHLSHARLTRVLPASRRNVPGVDRVVMDIDLGDAMLNPDRAPRLEPGDEIHVLAVREEVRNMVSLNGAVWRPGSYEYRPGMRAWDLIQAAQGLSPEAFTGRAHITRISAIDSTLVMIPFELGRNDDGTPRANPPLEEFDVVTVYSRAHRVEDLPVEVSGAVREPGDERFHEGMTLRDAILRAGGLRRTAHPVIEVARLADPHARAQGEISQIFRITVDSTYFLSDESARHYLGDRDGMRNNRNNDTDQAADFLLQPYDRIFVREIPDFALPRTVTLAGQVRHPGDYTLSRRDERLSDVLERAGGLTATAFPAGLRFTRDGEQVDVDLPTVLTRADHPSNLALLPGDSIFIPEYSPIVIVRGAVNSPTAVLYRRGANLDYYIRQAGGYARNADGGRTHIRYANGSGSAVSRSMLVFRSVPQPAPGSQITVPFKLEEDRVDVRGLITDLAGITASIATVFLIVRQLQ